MHFKDVRKLQIEDWFMLLVFCAYTVLIVFLNICADVSTNLIDPEDAVRLTPEEVKDRIWGSKCVLIVESMMCSVQWGTKACLLILYYRLTENLRQRIAVRIAVGYCVLTFIVMMSLYYGYWCRPFSAFYAVPTPDLRCATQIPHLIVNLVFNLTSDLLIIFIPLPMFIRAHLETKKKLLLVFPFSLGFFTMLCAILSKHLSFTEPFSSEWLFWYTREASTAVIVSNMPYSWAIVRKVFRLKSFLNSRSNSRVEAVSGRHPSTAARSITYDTNTKLPAPQSAVWNPFSREKKERMPSTTESTRGFSRQADDYAMTDWKDENDVNIKAEPFSSSSSEGTKSLGGRSHPSPIHDVDRLYRLDDDDLEDSTARQLGHQATRIYEP